LSPGRRLPKVVILFETPSRSPGPLCTGEALGLRLGRAGVGLAAGLNAPFEPGRLLAGFNASATGAGVSRDRCGLAAGRGEPVGRALFGLLAVSLATAETPVELGEPTLVDGVERSPGDAGTPERVDPAKLPTCRGGGLIAGREAEAVPGMGCARGLPEGRAFAGCFGLPVATVVLAGSVDLCADRGLAAQPMAAGAAGAGLYGDDGPLALAAVLPLAPPYDIRSSGLPSLAL